VQNRENILLADTPNDFAASVVSLLRDSGQRRRLGAAGRRLVYENYSWPKVAENFSRVLQHVLRR
jgi:glycosyltransferase involved in cell wall biosynthesis